MSTSVASRTERSRVRLTSPTATVRFERFLLPAIVGLATANFLWQLGASSYFVDEVQSIEAAATRLGGIVHAVSKIELTPPAYFFFLHEWMGRTGTQSAFVTRLPSAICGVALVAAIYWLALLVSDRRVALGAATLAALSPFVLEYAQRAQPYVFAMLAVTVAVAAALQADVALRHRGRWLVGAAAASVVALCLHYTDGYAIAVLCIWVFARRSLPRSWRLAFVSVCAAVELALVPLALAQHNSFPHRTGVADTAGVSWNTLGQMLGAPFDGRTGSPIILALIVTTLPAFVLLARRRTTGARPLLLAIAAGGPVVLTILSLFGADLMLTRYVAFAVPFEAIVMAIAVSELEGVRRGSGAALAAAIAALSLIGVFDSHRASGFYLNARGVASYIRSHERRDDYVIGPTDPGAQVALLYYHLAPDWAGSTQAARLVAAHTQRMWLISELPSRAPTASAIRADMVPAARALGYRPVSARVFQGTIPVTVVLEVPLRPRATVSASSPSLVDGGLHRRA